MESDDDEPKVLRSWPLVRLDQDGRPMWAVMGEPGEYAYDMRLESLWRRAQRWVQADMFQEAA